MIWKEIKEIWLYSLMKCEFHEINQSSNTNSHVKAITISWLMISAIMQSMRAWVGALCVRSTIDTSVHVSVNIIIFITLQYTFLCHNTRGKNHHKT